MIRFAATAVAVGLLGSSLLLLSAPLARAAGPFPDVPIPPPPHHPHGWALASLAAGAGLIGASFTFADAANRRYDDYLHATDPARIERFYDRTVLLDRLSTGSLVSGEALIAVSIYVAFLRRAESPGLSLALAPSRCGISMRF